jgi:hypothetical protein
MIFLVAELVDKSSLTAYLLQNARQNLLDECLNQDQEAKPRSLRLKHKVRGKPVKRARMRGKARV